MQPEMAAFYKSSVPTAILLPFFILYPLIHYLSIPIKDVIKISFILKYQTTKISKKNCKKDYQLA